MSIIIIYYTSFIRYNFIARVFLEHEERSEECYKANKCDKMAYVTIVIQYFFYCIHILNFKLKKVQNTMLGKLYLVNIKGW
jgi:hypothetical protein